MSINDLEYWCAQAHPKKEDVKESTVSEEVQRLMTGGLPPSINVVNESARKVAIASADLKAFMMAHGFDNNETLISILDLLHISLDILSKAKV